jgi:hypothetical protein
MKTETVLLLGVGAFGLYLQSKSSAATQAAAAAGTTSQLQTNTLLSSLQKTLANLQNSMSQKPASGGSSLGGGSGGGSGGGGTGSGGGIGNVGTGFGQGSAADQQEADQVAAQLAALQTDPNADAASIAELQQLEQGLQDGTIDPETAANLDQALADLYGDPTIDPTDPSTDPNSDPTYDLADPNNDYNYDSGGDDF